MNSLNMQIAIDFLIAHNEASRDRDAIKFMPLHVYAQERCTVRVDCGRRTGKTYYIQSHATKGDLVVVGSQAQAKQYSPGSFSLCTISDLPDRVRGMIFSRVYVDEPSMCFKPGNMKVEHFYHLLMNPNHPTFVFLGTP